MDPYRDDSAWSSLMAATQAGDQAAYRRLLTEIVPFLRVILRPLFRRGAEDVEDVVQETLLTLHRIRHTYDPARPFKPWLTAVARRRAIDHLRRGGAARQQECPLEDQHAGVADGTAGASEESLLFARDVARAIARLPAGQQRALMLLRVRGLSLAEAAAETGQSEGALKVAVHRAGRTLARLLGLERREGAAGPERSPAPTARPIGTKPP